MFCDTQICLSMMIFDDFRLIKKYTIVQFFFVPNWTLNIYFLFKKVSIKIRPIYPVYVRFSNSRIVCSYIFIKENCRIEKLYQFFLEKRASKLTWMDICCSNVAGNSDYSIFS